MGLALLKVPTAALVALVVVAATLVGWALLCSGWLRWLPAVLVLGALALIYQLAPGAIGSGRFERALHNRYQQLWHDLEQEAEGSAQDVGRLTPPAELEDEAPEAVRSLFVALESEPGDVSKLLVNDLGQVVAWSGPSLPIETRLEGGFAESLPARGGVRAFVRPAFVTLTVTYPVQGELWRGWLVTAARSFANTELPWPGGQSVRWSVDADSGVPSGAIVVDGGRWPDLWVSEQGWELREPPPRSAVWLATVGVLLALAMLLTSPASDDNTRWAAAMTIAGALLSAASVQWWIAILWLALVFLAWVLVRAESRRDGVTQRVSFSWIPAAWGLAAVAAAVTASGGAGAGSAASLTMAGLRPLAPSTLLLLCFVACCAWILQAGNPSEKRDRNRMPMLPVLALLAVLAFAAAMADHPSLVLLTSIGVLWWLQTRWQRIPAFGALMVLAILMSTAWTAGERIGIAQTNYRSRDQLSLLSDSEQRQLREEIRDSLAELDVVSLSLGQTSLGALEALAYGLWQGSALNQPQLHSVLAVTSEGEVTSSYEAGLEVAATRIETEATRSDLRARRELQNPERLQGANSQVSFNGAYFADLEYAWQPAAGFKWSRGSNLPPAEVTVTGSDVAALHRQRVRPGLLTNSFSHVSSDGAYRLTLDPLAPAAAIERVAARVALAVSLVLVVFAIARTGVQPSRWTQRIRALSRSYPRRLALTLGALMLLPLLLLDLAVLTLHQRGLQAARAQLEQAALDSARRAVFSYLDALPSNFAVTDLDDNRLMAIAAVVGRDVDLYWNNRVRATSRANHFASGEIAPRLPASVFRDLILHRLPRSRSQPPAAQEASVFAPLNPRRASDDPDLILAVPASTPGYVTEAQARVLRSRVLLIGFTVLLLGLWATARAARGFSRPILEMISGTERIAAGASSLGIDLPEEQDLGRLATAIDRMAADVSALQERERVERELVERILANVTTGLVLVDETGVVSRSNPVAEQMLGVTAGDRFPQGLHGPVAEIPVFSEVDARGTTAQGTVEIEIDGEERLWHVSRLAVERHLGMSSLWVIEDVSEVVRGERLAAWAEMARMIAHEVKNPLTPIRLSAEHLREVFRDGEPDGGASTVERCTNNILSQVEDLRQIADEFSDYSRIPEVRPEVFAVEPWLASLTDSYRPDAQGSEVELHFADDAPAQIFADRRLLTRVLRNLVENALRAGGSSPVTIHVSTVVDKRVEIVVADRGSGVPADDLEHIFEPYFSTRETGTGLGLPISKRIVEAHGGTIRAESRSDGGLRVRVVLPVGDARGERVDTREGVE